MSAREVTEDCSKDADKVRIQIRIDDETTDYEMESWKWVELQDWLLKNTIPVEGDKDG